jgi:hypothetical protein
MEITIETTATSKRTVKLCRVNTNNTLTVIGSAKVTVITDFAASTEVCNYKGEAYTVQGNIYMSYIVVA